MYFIFCRTKPLIVSSKGCNDVVFWCSCVILKNNCDIYIRWWHPTTNNSQNRPWSSCSSLTLQYYDSTVECTVYLYFFPWCVPILFSTYTFTSHVSRVTGSYLWQNLIGLCVCYRIWHVIQWEIPVSTNNIQPNQPKLKTIFRCISFTAIQVKYKITHLLIESIHTYIYFY